MNIDRNYIIMQPFQLPWRYVSPAHFKGLDYHLSADLKIRFESLYNSTQRVGEGSKPLESPEEMELEVGAEIFSTYDEGHFAEADGINAEKTFMNEIMPLKSQERINKVFNNKNEQLSCFFTENQMAHFQFLFDTSFYICHRVSVLYKGREVNDIAELPHKEFNLALDAFAELNIQATLDYKKSKEEIEQAYEHFFEKNVAKEDEKQKKTLWDKVKGKDTNKNIMISIGLLFAGPISLFVGKEMLKSEKVFVKAAGGLLTANGIILEMFGKQKLNNLIKLL